MRANVQGLEDVELVKLAPGEGRQQGAEENCHQSLPKGV